MTIRLTILPSLMLCLVACKTNRVDTHSTGPTQPYGGRPHVIPGKIEAEHYDEGRPEEAYHDLDVKNKGADYRGITQVDIEERPDASNGYGIGWTRAGEWVVYTVIVQESGTYTVDFPVASKKRGGTFHLEFSGKDVTGPIAISDTGSWQKLVMIRKGSVHLKAGIHLMKLVMDLDGESKGIGDIDFIRFSKAP